MVVPQRSQREHLTWRQRVWLLITMELGRWPSSVTLFFRKPFSLLHTTVFYCKGNGVTSHIHVCLISPSERRLFEGESSASCQRLTEHSWNHERETTLHDSKKNTHKPFFKLKYIACGMTTFFWRRNFCVANFFVVKNRGREGRKLSCCLNEKIE